MRFAKTCLAGAAVITASACAAKQPGSTGPIVDRVQVIGTRDPAEISYKAAGPSSANATLDYPAARVWALVPSVYAVLSIPISAVDSTQQLVVGNVRMRRVFRDQSVTSLVDCGNSITGPNAATYSVNMKMTTQVGASGPTASRVRTIVDASGTSSGGASVRCSSTGALEGEILKRLEQGLSQSQ